MFWLSISAARQIFEDNDAEMKKKIDMFNEERRPQEEIDFLAFEESMNIIFGLANYDENWDILNNPYVEYKGQMMSNGMKLTNSLELWLCPDEEKGRFVPEKNFGWYP